MDDPADVGDAEGAGDIEPDPGRLARGEPADSTQPRGQVLALDELHHQERLAVVGAGLEAADDVRVAQHGRGEGFAPEAHRDVGVLDDLAPKQLDRDRSIEPRVRRAVDGGHPADADQLRQPVAGRDQPADVSGWSGGFARLAHAATIDQVPRTGRMAGPGRSTE